MQTPDLMNTCICKHCTFTVPVGGKGKKRGIFWDAATGPSARCPELLPGLLAVGFPFHRGNRSKTNEAIQGKRCLCAPGASALPRGIKKKKAEGNEGSKSTLNPPVLERRGQGRLKDVRAMCNFLQKQGLPEVFPSKRNRAEKWIFVSLR